MTSVLGPLLLLLTLESQSAPELVSAPGVELVKRHCLACHSAGLIAQNRADQQGWTQMIRWMQRTQGLWELGEDEAEIVAYLAEHYGVSRSGRRQPLHPDLMPPSGP